MTRRAFLLTGPKGAGKTTALAHLAAALADAGANVGGVLQPARFRGGRKHGYDAVVVGDGAELLPASELGAAPELARGVWTVRLAQRRQGPRGGYDFYPDAWEEAAHAVRAARAGAEVLIVDELGWVESQGRGHAPALFDELPDGSPDETCHTIIAAVRQDKVEHFREKLAPVAGVWEVPDVPPVADILG